MSNTNSLKLCMGRESEFLFAHQGYSTNIQTNRSQVQENRDWLGNMLSSISFRYAEAAKRTNIGVDLRCATGRICLHGQSSGRHENEHNI